MAKRCGDVEYDCHLLLGLDLVAPIIYKYRAITPRTGKR